MPLQRQHPVWVRDGNIYTSAGISAGIDLALAWVEEDCGTGLAQEAARELAGGRTLPCFMRNPGRCDGIVSNVKQFTLDEAATFDIYIPLSQMDDSAVPWIIDNQFWEVRAAVAPNTLKHRLREALSRTDRGACASNIEGLDWYLGAALRVRRFNLTLIAAFGLTSLLLAITGVYSVLSYSLSLRTREIGTRIALGASPQQILRMVLGQAACLVLVGLVVGILASLGVTRFMRDLLYGVHAMDSSVLVDVSIVVFVCALLSCVVPAIRASHTEPISVLRAS